MPKPPFADGPWGEAIRYWLNERKWLQADLASTTGIRANTISRATRGFHTTTRVLEKIADAFMVPLDAVLVSPERRHKNEDRRRLAREITEDVLRAMDAKAGDAMAAAIATTEQAVKQLEQKALAQSRPAKGRAARVTAPTDPIKQPKPKKARRAG